MTNVLARVRKLFSGNVSHVLIECGRQLQKNISPGGASACVFTSIYMYLSTKVKIPPLQEFYDACTKAGLVRRKDAYIYDYDKIVRLAGINKQNYKTNFTPAEAKELLKIGQPFLISTETHTELCNGYTEAPNGDLTFHVIDPHSKNDVAFNTRDMKLYNNDGAYSGRTVKTMRYFV
jgi:hypothetical protein